LTAARELTKRAAEAAITADSKENAAIWWENAALREAASGDASQGVQDAADGLKLAPESQGVGVEAALAFAMASETAEPYPWPKTWTSGIRSIPRCSHFGCLLFAHNWR